MRIRVNVPSFTLAQLVKYLASKGWRCPTGLATKNMHFYFDGGIFPYNQISLHTGSFKFHWENIAEEIVTKLATHENRPEYDVWEDIKSVQFTEESESDEQRLPSDSD